MKEVSKLLLVLIIASCSNTPEPKYPVDQQAQMFYGKAYWAMAALNMLQENTDKEDLQKALVMVNYGVRQLKYHTVKGERCGLSGVRCDVYLLAAITARAGIYSALNMKEQSVADLMWLHQKGYMKHVVKKIKFWEEKVFDNVKSHPKFQYLVNIYRK